MIFCIFQPYITSGYYTFQQLYFVYFNLTSQVVTMHSTSSILYISTLHHKWLLYIPPALFCIFQPYIKSGYYTFHQLYFVYFNLTSQVVTIHSTSSILYISTLHQKWLLYIPLALFCIFQPHITSVYYTFHQLYFVYFNLTSQVVTIHSTSSILYISTLHQKWFLYIPPALFCIFQPYITSGYYAFHHLYGLFHRMF